MLSLAPDPDFVESGSNPDPDSSPPKSSSKHEFSFLGTVLARDPDPDLDPLTQLNPDPIRIRTPENMNFFIYIAPFLGTV
jgi:hypothetical protein